MTVLRDGDVIRMEGDCPVEEAEMLAAQLEGGGAGRIVDASQCRSAHSAVIQVLLRFRPVLQGPPRSAFLREMIMPALHADSVLGATYGN